MNEILDDEQFLEEEGTTGKSSRLREKAWGYMVFMILPGTLLYFFRTGALFPENLYGAIGITITCLLLSGVFEAVRLFMRKRKEKRTGKVKKVEPFWFQVIEGAFAFWILLMALSFARLMFFT